MEGNCCEPWAITKPFDTFLLKFWSENDITRFEDSLSGLNAGEIVEALTPNRKKRDYYENDILHQTFQHFCEAPNLCDKYKFCQNVTQHSIGLACVTGAAIRKRLKPYHDLELGTLNSRIFQNDVISQINSVTKRKNLGVLVFDCPGDYNSLRNHAMKVLFDNFYLYTTPRIERFTPEAAYQEVYINNVVTFILKQISRNADCMIIFVDNVMTERWSHPRDFVAKILYKSICWDFKIKVIILSVCPNGDSVASDIYKYFITLKPVVLMYHELEMAPSGGLVSLVEQACNLSLRDTLRKYWLRGLEVLNVFKISNIVQED